MTTPARSIVLGLGLLLGLAAAPAMAAPAVWTVDPAASKLAFQGAVNGAPFAGVFRRWNAQIAFDPKALAASHVAVSVDVASAASGDADRDQSMPATDWFWVAKFARASFVSHAFRDLGGGRYVAVGDLTLRGVTRPISLPFTLSIAGDKAVMKGATVIDRTAFGVGQGQWKTGDVVATKVTVNVAVTAHRAP
ncbi:MAG TPA: YceI family protein [Caulobacteraceae bacterium]|nr:YceI family protein [Caulobacteraceae bacterium]